MPKPNPVPLVRPLTRQMADRIRVLVDSCQTFQEDSKLTIYPGARTFGGDPFENLSGELNLLLHGHKPSPDIVCKEIKQAKPVKKGKR